MKQQTVGQVLTDVYGYLRSLSEAQQQETYRLIFTKEFGVPHSDPLRPSSAGKCSRQLAYKLHHPELAKPMEDRAIANFLAGDLFHELERDLISRVATLHSVEKKVSWHPDFVEGSIDGILSLEGRDVLLDIKTTNERSYRDMTKNGADEGYIKQVNLYMAATGLKEAYLWVVNKNGTGGAGDGVYSTGQRAIIPIPYRPNTVQETLDKFTAIRNSTPRNLPERDYTFALEIAKGKQTGRQYLPWQCSYCDFTTQCWGSAGFKKVFESGKVRWIKDTKAKVSDAEALEVLG